KRSRQFLEKVWNVVVKGRGIEVLSRGELLDVVPPLVKQSRGFLADEPRQSMHVIGDLLLCSRISVFASGLSANRPRTRTQKGARSCVRTRHSSPCQACALPLS